MLEQLKAEWLTSGNIDKNLDRLTSNSLSRNSNRYGYRSR
jgi:hypothetical protein